MTPVAAFPWEQSEPQAQGEGEAEEEGEQEEEEEQEEEKEDRSIILNFLRPFYDRMRKDDLINIASVFGVRVPDGGFTKSRLVCRFQEKLLCDYLDNIRIVKIAAPTVEKLSEMKIFYVLSESGCRNTFRQVVWALQAHPRVPKAVRDLPVSSFLLYRKGHRLKYGWKLHRFVNRTVELKIGEDTTPSTTSSEVETPAQTGISSAAAAAADDNELLTGAQEFGGGAVPGQAPFISMIQAAIAADLGAAAAAADAEFTSALQGAPQDAVPPPVPIEPGDFWYLTSLLNGIHFNPSPRPYVVGESLFLGVRRNFWHVPHEHRQITTLLNACLRKHIPDFTFTSIALNKNTVSEEHKDSANLLGTTSVILGLGDYSEGHLRTFGANGGNHWDTWDIRGYLLRFNGRLPHASTHFQGERFSVVWHTHKSWISAQHKPEAVSDLLQLGFNLPQQTAAGAASEDLGDAADAEFHSPVPTPQPATQDRESQEILFEHISCPVFLFNFYVNEETGKIFSRSSISWHTHTDPKLLESCF